MAANARVEPPARPPPDRAAPPGFTPRSGRSPFSSLNACPSWNTIRLAGAAGSYCAGTYTQYVCCVPGYALLGSTNDPRISPFGTPSCGIESGPSRYCEFAFGPGGVGCSAPPLPPCCTGAAGACAKAISADAATAMVRKVAVRFFMGCGPPPLADYIRSARCADQQLKTGTGPSNEAGEACRPPRVRKAGNGVAPRTGSPGRGGGQAASRRFVPPRSE